MLTKLKKQLKNQLKKIIYPYTYSSDAYIKYIRKSGGVIGERCIIYDPINTRIDITTDADIFLEIGNDVQITSGCRFLLHDYSYSVIGNAYHDLPRMQRKTVIGNNVFIGTDSIILMGSRIGDNVIIGAGSVVCGNVDSNSVYAGNPAKKIKSLEEHYGNCKRRFVESAKCYAEGMKKIKKDIVVDDMIIYQALFSSKEKIKNYIKEAEFKGMSEEAKEAITMNYEHYDSIEELLREQR